MLLGYLKLTAQINNTLGMNNHVVPHGLLKTKNIFKLKECPKIQKEKG